MPSQQNSSDDHEVALPTSPAPTHPPNTSSLALTPIQQNAGPKGILKHSSASSTDNHKQTSDSRSLGKVGNAAGASGRAVSTGNSINSGDSARSDKTIAENTSRKVNAVPANASRNPDNTRNFLNIGKAAPSAGAPLNRTATATQSSRSGERIIRDRFLASRRPQAVNSATGVSSNPKAFIAAAAARAAKTATASATATMTAPVPAPAPKPVRLPNSSIGRTGSHIDLKAQPIRRVSNASQGSNSSASSRLVSPPLSNSAGLSMNSPRSQPHTYTRRASTSSVNGSGDYNGASAAALSASSSVAGNTAQIFGSQRSRSTSQSSLATNRSVSQTGHHRSISVNTPYQPRRPSVVSSSSLMSSDTSSRAGTPTPTATVEHSPGLSAKAAANAANLINSTHTNDPSHVRLPLSRRRSSASVSGVSVSSPVNPSSSHTNLASLAPLPSLAPLAQTSVPPASSSDAKAAPTNRSSVNNAALAAGAAARAILNKPADIEPKEPSLSEKLRSNLAQALRRDSVKEVEDVKEEDPETTAQDVLIRTHNMLWKRATERQEQKQKLLQQQQQQQQVKSSRSQGTLDTGDIAPEKPNHMPKSDQQMLDSFIENQRTKLQRQQSPQISHESKDALESARLSVKMRPPLEPRISSDSQSTTQSSSQSALSAALAARSRAESQVAKIHMDLNNQATTQYVTKRAKYFRPAAQWSAIAVSHLPQPVKKPATTDSSTRTGTMSSTVSQVSSKPVPAPLHAPSSSFQQTLRQKQHPRPTSVPASTVPRVFPERSSSLSTNSGYISSTPTSAGSSETALSRPHPSSAGSSPSASSVSTGTELKRKKGFWKRLLRSSGHSEETSEVAQETKAPMIQTLRKSHDDKMFNADKPWKHHKDESCLTEKGRKRYERVWAANRGTFLKYFVTFDIEGNPIMPNDQDSIHTCATNTNASMSDTASTNAVESSPQLQPKLIFSDEETTMNGGKDATAISIGNDSEETSSNTSLNHVFAALDTSTPHLLPSASPSNLASDGAFPNASSGVNAPNTFNSGSSTTAYNDTRMSAPFQMIPATPSSTVPITISSPTGSSASGLMAPPRNRPGSPASLALSGTSLPISLTPMKSVASLLSSASSEDTTSTMVANENDVHGYVVARLWKRSTLSPDTLSQIWDLVDTNKDGTLDRSSFVVGMWLVDQCLYGKKLPTKVDETVWQSVGKLHVKIRVDRQRKSLVQRVPHAAAKGGVSVVRATAKTAAKGGIHVVRRAVNGVGGGDRPQSGQF